MTYAPYFIVMIFLHLDAHAVARDGGDDRQVEEVASRHLKPFLFAYLSILQGNLV